MNESTFHAFGFGFQVKVLSCFLTDRDFAKQTVDSLESKYFENTAIKWLVENTVSYFKEYKLAPTIEVYKVQVSNLEKGSLLQTEVVRTLGEIYKGTKSEDLQFIKDRTVKFLRHQNVTNAISESVGLIDKDDIEGAIKLINDAANKVQLEHDLGHDYLIDVDYRYTEKAEKEKIKTGFDVLDEVMNGGLPKGKFGIVMAPTGVGKSWMLAALGANALKNGKTVLHYTLELDDIYTAMRYDTILTGISFADLTFHQNTIKKTLAKFEGKLFIKEFPSGTLSLNELDSHIDQYILLGSKPDLVLIDYPELMKINFNASSRDDKVLGQLYVDLRGLAGTKDFALWGADQTNKSGTDKDEIGSDSISNAFAKMFVVDFMMSLSRRVKDKMNNTARIHIAKSRLGTDGITFPCKFDTETGSIQVFNEKSETGKKVKKEMISDEEYQRQSGAKYYEMMNKSRTEPKLDEMF